MACSRSIRAVAFDLDGTLLREETVCEILAQRLGYLARMRELERVTGREAIISAREEMVGWYRESRCADLVEHLKDANLAPGALEGIALLRQASLEIFIVSITWSFAVEHFARCFGASAWLGTELRQDGTIGHVWAEDKVTWLESKNGERGLTTGEVAAVGDSSNDIPLLNVAGLSFFLGSKFPSTLSASVRYRPAADIRDIAAEILKYRSSIS